MHDAPRVVVLEFGVFWYRLPAPELPLLQCGLCIFLYFEWTVERHHGLEVPYQLLFQSSVTDRDIEELHLNRLAGVDHDEASGEPHRPCLLRKERCHETRLGSGKNVELWGGDIESFVPPHS